MGLFQKPAKPPGPAAVEARRRASACPARKKGRKLLKMREPGRNDMIAVSSLRCPRVGPGEGGWKGEGRGTVTATLGRCRASPFAIPVPKLKVRDYDGAAPIGPAAKPNVERRHGRAGGTWTSNVVVTDGNTNRHPRNTRGLFTMATKYAFGQGLKELRFLFCQTSEHSAATRYATPTSITSCCDARTRRRHEAEVEEYTS
jgi:hypothetical protein